jgi:hypothetical protein
MAITFSIPTSSVGEFQLLRILTSHLMLSVFLILATQIGMQDYLIKALVYIFLMTKNAEYLFICLCAICMSSVVRCLNPLSIFKLNF